MRRFGLVTEFTLAFAAVAGFVALLSAYVGALPLVLAAAGAGWLLARRLAAPLDELSSVVNRFADGDLDVRVGVEGSSEIAGFARALNRAAGVLQARIRGLEQVGNEQSAVLSSMVEGVLVVDGDERVMAVNDAGAKLLGIDREQAVGKSIQVAVRNSQLQALVSDAVRVDEPIERDIDLRDTTSRYLLGNGAPVRDSAGWRIGAVIVLNDVTRMRRLEAVRRDFVANVSHELRTPITSIKGFVETLLDGALDDRATAERFLTITKRQAGRLDSIIEDLLTLSRLEDESEGRSLSLRSAPVAPVVDHAVEVCSAAVEGSRDRIDVECDAQLSASINAPLLEQAFVNLISNALKYSDEAGRVVVRVSETRDGVEISVTDSGNGIEAKHLPRLFERFYRIDTARSRELGGTGLGLAIVKHIAQVHAGSVGVTSRVGVGSTFAIRLPGQAQAGDLADGAPLRTAAERSTP